MDTALAKAVDRLDAVLAAETQALRANLNVNFPEIAGRKNQSLLELSRLGKSLDGAPSEELRARLMALKGRIEENQRVLELHVHASREIASIISDSIRRAESDGTYSDRVAQKDADR